MLKWLQSSSTIPPYKAGSAFCVSLEALAIRKAGSGFPVYMPASGIIDQYNSAHRCSAFVPTLCVSLCKNSPSYTCRSAIMVTVKQAYVSRDEGW